MHLLLFLDASEASRRTGCSSLVLAAQVTAASSHPLLQCGHNSPFRQTDSSVATSESAAMPTAEGVEGVVLAVDGVPLFASSIVPSFC